MKPRYKDRIRLKCSVTFTTGLQTGEGRVLDLTSPGCLIESAVAVQKDQSVQLKMSLPGVKSPFIVTLGVVRWSRGNQFGVEFIKMDEANRVVLDRFMAHHIADLLHARTGRQSFSDPGGQNWHLETYGTSKDR